MTINQRINYFISLLTLKALKGFMPGSISDTFLVHEWCYNIINNYTLAIARTHPDVLNVHVYGLIEQWIIDNLLLLISLRKHLIANVFKLISSTV